MKQLHMISLACAAMCALGVAAQDINTEITIEREVVPEQRAATRPDVAPKLLLPSVAPVNLSVSDRSETTEVPPYMSRLEPVAFTGRQPYGPWRGYLSGGYFPAYNLDLSGGYRLYQDRTSSADVYGQFNGTAYDSFYRDSYMIGANAVYADDKGRKLNAVIDFGQSYYSRNSEMMDSLYKARYTTFNIDLGAELPLWENAKLNVNGAFNMADVSMRPKSRPHQIKSNHTTDYQYKLGVMAQWMYNELSKWNVELKATIVRPNFNNIYFDHYNSYISDNIACYTNFLIRFNPYYLYTSHVFTAKLGMAVDVMNCSKDKDICSICEFKFEDKHSETMVSPDLYIAWRPSGMFTIWGEMNGKAYVNYLGTLYAEMPYVAGLREHGLFSKVPVAINAGINFGPLNGASLQLRARYANAENWIMASDFNNDMYGMDVDGLLLGAEFRYDYGSLFGMRVSYDRVAGSDNAYYLWRDRAQWQLLASLWVRPVDRLSMELSWNGRMDRYAFSYWSRTEGYVSVSSGDVASLDLGADYRLSSRLGLFVRLENMLGNKWLMIGGVPAQGFHGLVGATYRF